MRYDNAGYLPNMALPVCIRHIAQHHFPEMAQPFAPTDATPGHEIQILCSPFERRTRKMGKKFPVGLPPYI